MSGAERLRPRAQAAPLAEKPRACAGFFDKLGATGTAILIGYCAGVWVVAVLAAIKYGPAAFASVSAWLRAL